VDAPKGGPVRLINCITVPTFGVDAKRRVDPRGIIKFIQATAPQWALIERAQAMPDQGSSSGFIYGRAVGALEAYVMGFEIPLRPIESSAWKKAMALTRKHPDGTQMTTGEVKEASRQKALAMFSNGAEFFPRRGDHNVAEACLIAAYGAMLRA
jgi:hypothetical protein